MEQCAECTTKRKPQLVVDNNRYAYCCPNCGWAPNHYSTSRETARLAWNFAVAVYVSEDEKVVS